MTTGISVVTATLNRRDQLVRAIESVIAQGLDGVEHIIVDGLSTDGTLEMLARYPHLKVLSEADTGLYQAWNKGLRLATQDVICILNSDDEIPEGAFARIRAAYEADPEADMLSGAVELREMDANGQVSARVIDAPPILALREQDVGPGIPITNGRFLTRRLVGTVGFFNERFRLVSDRDYLLRVLLVKPRNTLVPGVVYRYWAHAGSLTLSGTAATDGLARESLAMAQEGTAAATNPATRAAYARWHAWTVFYQAGLDLRHGRVARALATVWRGFRTDPFWAVRLPGPLLRHVRERGSRLGRPVEI